MRQRQPKSSLPGLFPRPALIDRRDRVPDSVRRGAYHERRAFIAYGVYGVRVGVFDHAGPFPKCCFKPPFTGRRGETLPIGRIPPLAPAIPAVHERLALGLRKFTPAPEPEDPKLLLLQPF